MRTREGGCDEKGEWEKRKKRISRNPPNNCHFFSGKAQEMCT